MKYKLDSKKYRKSDFEKYKNISNKILKSEKSDLIDMCPDFDFFIKRLDVFLDSSSGRFKNL